MEKSGDGPILFFDGVCGLCNWIVDFILSRDSERQFRFAPLQGETARAMLGDRVSVSFETAIVLDQGRVFEKSDGILRVFARLGGIWRVAILLKWIPRSVRDAIYDQVARNRYRWFGKRESCRLPSPQEKNRFI